MLPIGHIDQDETATSVKTYCSAAHEPHTAKALIQVAFIAFIAFVAFVAFVAFIAFVASVAFVAFGYHMLANILVGLFK